MKGCGKSAPRKRQRKRHGKPHREQNRIGTARRAILGIRVSPGSCRPGRLLEAPATGVPEEWPSRAVRLRAAPYRTRLTGRLIFSEGVGGEIAGPSPSL